MLDLTEQVNKHFKDINESFNGYYHYMRREIEDGNLLHEYNWIQLFDSLYDNANIS